MRDNFEEYVKEVDEARRKAGRQPLDFKSVWAKKEVTTPRVGTHSFGAGRAAAIAARREADEAAIAWANEEETFNKSSRADMYAEMEKLWGDTTDTQTDPQTS